MSLSFQPTPRRILIRGVNWLGDAVMTTPALMRLREAFPQARFTLSTPQKLAGLWLHHPAVDDIIAFAPHENIFAVSKKLRAAKCDLAVILPNSPRAALEVWLAGIPQRLGYARPWRNCLLTQTVAPRAAAVKMRKRSSAEIKMLVARNPQPNSRETILPPAAHQLYEYLHLTAVLGASTVPLAPQLAITLEELAAARKKFGLEALSMPILGLNPGAEYGPAKRWPVEKFIAAAREIQRRHPCFWILFGGSNDAPITEQIESALGGQSGAVLNLAGKTSLRELMSLLKLCRVVLTNDTGPMHVAAALGTRVVVPFGSTSPALTGPGLPGDTRHHFITANAPCSPCFLRECPIDFRCMRDISLEIVVEAVVQSLNESSH
jgi:heptosyltransferase-2